MNLLSLLGDESQAMGYIAFSAVSALIFGWLSKHADKLFGKSGDQKVIWSYAERLEFFKMFCRFFFYVSIASAVVYSVILILIVLNKH